MTGRLSFPSKCSTDAAWVTCQCWCAPPVPPSWSAGAQWHGTCEPESQSPWLAHALCAQRTPVATQL